MSISKFRPVLHVASRCNNWLQSQTGGEGTTPKSSSRSVQRPDVCGPRRRSSRGALGLLIADIRCQFGAGWWVLPGLRSNLLATPMIPSRKVMTHDTKMPPWTTGPHAPSGARYCSRVTMMNAPIRGPETRPRPADQRHEDDLSRCRPMHVVQRCKLEHDRLVLPASPVSAAERAKAMSLCDPPRIPRTGRAIRGLGLLEHLPHRRVNGSMDHEKAGQKMTSTTV